MKNPSLQPSALSGNRRGFLKTAGLTALAGAAVAPTGLARGFLPVLRCTQLVAEGVIDPRFILPPLTEAPPIPPGLEVRLRATFPVRDWNILAVQVYLAPIGADLPLPVPPPPILPDPNPTLSYLEVRVSWAEIGRLPLPNFALLGRVILNNPASPFGGNVTGAVLTLSAAYQIESDDSATFTLLGANVAGNHISMAPTAKGLVVVQ